MGPDASAARDVHNTVLHRLLGGMSVFTMAMTVPQVWTIWVGRQAASVSLWSWGAYLLSAMLWFWYGLRKRGQEHLLAMCRLGAAGRGCHSRRSSVWITCFHEYVSKGAALHRPR